MERQNMDHLVCIVIIVVDAFYVLLLGERNVEYGERLISQN